MEEDITKGKSNITSVIWRLKLYHQKNEQEFTTYVLLKIPSLSENYHRLKPIHYYTKEVYVYETIIPQMYQFWDGATFAPQIYDIFPEFDIIVMEDLHENGFLTKDKFVQLDFDHCLTALHTLAEFHALSFKYIQKTKIENLPEYMYYEPEMEPSFRKFCRLYYDRFFKIVSSLAPASIVNKLLDKKTKFWDLETQLLPWNKKHRDMLIHGDFQTGNISFKYDEKDRVCSSKLIDFQLCRLGSPSIDLIFFFVGSVQFEVVESKWDTLIDSYLKTLDNSFKKLQCDFTYTVEDLNEDFNENKYLYIHYLGAVIQWLTCPNGVTDDQDDLPSKMYKDLVSNWLAYFEAKGIF